MIREERATDGLIDFAVGVAAFQFFLAGAFTALTLWLDRPFEPGRRDALIVLVLCASVAIFALTFLLRLNVGRLLQAGFYALGTLALALACALAVTDFAPGALVVAGLVAIAGSAARAYVSPQVRAWSGARDPVQSRP